MTQKNSIIGPAVFIIFRIQKKGFDPRATGPCQRKGVFFIADYKRNTRLQRAACDRVNDRLEICPVSRNKNSNSFHKHLIVTVKAVRSSP